MMRGTRRDQYRPMIHAILERCKGMDLKAKREELRKGFPSGPREHHPYKIWLDECRVQLGLKPVVKGSRGLPVIGQNRLFESED